MALDLTRRRLIGGIGLLLCAPTIVRAASLMPVRAIKMPSGFVVTQVDGQNVFTTLHDWAAMMERNKTSGLSLREKARSITGYQPDGR